MRLNYKRVISLHLVLLLAASCLSAADARSEREAAPRLLVYRPDLSSENLAKSNEETEGAPDSDQNLGGKHKGDQPNCRGALHAPADSGKLEKDKSEAESKAEDSDGVRIRGRHGLDSFGTNPLNLGPLNLTTEQRDKIQTMRKESSKKARSLRSSLKAKRAEMRDLMFDPKATNKQILKARDQARRLHEQADDLMVQDFLAIRNLLTAEQKRHLPDIKPNRQEANTIDTSRSNHLPKPADRQ